MQENGNYPVRHDNRTARIKSTAESTGGKITGIVFSVCLCVLLIAVTIRLVFAMFN